MSDIKFSKQEQDIITNKIQRYFEDELEQEIGQFDAQFLLDFFTKEVGVYYYNHGLYDAQVILTRKLEDISEAILGLEKMTDTLPTGETK